MVATAALAKAAAGYAGKYLLSKGKDAAIGLGKAAIGKVGSAISKKTGINFSQNKAHMGAVNKIKNELSGKTGQRPAAPGFSTRPLKETLASAFKPSEMSAAKEAMSKTIGGVQYGKKKLMRTGKALSYGRKGMRKTRR